MLDNFEKKKKKFVPYPKGRSFDNKSLEEINELISSLPLSRDLLIEYLHLIQDKYKCIKKKHLAALSSIMKIPFAETFEVATFYAHFDVIDDNEKVPPEITIRVCDSLTCELKGAQKLINELKDTCDPDKVRILRAPCMGLCDKAPACEVGHNHLTNVNVEEIKNAVSKKLTHPKIVKGILFDEYIKNGGYDTLNACYENKLSFEKITETLNESGLKGMGGAGFPAGQKWKFVKLEKGPRLMTINGDEGEPGTFKDKLYLENDMHRFFEGMLIAAWAVEAEQVYIYLRDEYPGIRIKMIEELQKLKDNKIIKGTEVFIRRGAGAYICGEESAMIESIEGKRGLPRHRPPFVSKVGLFGKPTLNHNIETVFWVREILEKGSKWFSNQGIRGRKGPHSFSVSGRVKNPGVKLAPAGVTMNELIKDYCGGMENGHSFYGYLPGGASGGILPASMADIPLDFGTLDEYGCFIGSGAIVVFSDKDDITKVVINLLKFFEDESCGQCTPCRVGTEKAVKLLEKRDWNKGLLKELVSIMGDASICGLGQAAGNPITCAINYFGEDLNG
ncbi:NAD(P)H-dependent oxidoreductase subunit E [Rickettsiales bacterium]|nr:NAD(P)H-dependent oxidoreductase subunit E [Rickettsiales bacterium]